MHACRRLLRAAVDTRQELAARRVQRVHEVAAVVDEQHRLRIERAVDEGEILLLRAAVPGEDLDAVLDERRRHVILRRKRVAARDGDLCPRVREHLRHIGCLRLEVQRDDHADARKRLRLGELLIDGAHHRHEVLHPRDLIMPRRRQFNITNHRLHEMNLLHTVTDRYILLVNPQERKPQAPRDWLDLLQGRAHNVHAVDVCAFSLLVNPQERKPQAPRVTFSVHPRARRSP